VVEDGCAFGDPGLTLPEALPCIGERRRLVPAYGDEEALRVVAMHLDEPVLVRRVAEHDEEDKIVVVLALGALSKVLRVLDRERMEAERLLEKLDVLWTWAVKVEPEEIARLEPFLEALAVEGEYVGAAPVDEVRLQSERSEVALSAGG
jgi:hypothetical protein